MNAAQLISIQVSMAAIVFGVGLNASGQDVVGLLRRPGLLARSLLSMNLIMPVIAAVLAATFGFHRALEVALITLAVSPVPPGAPQQGEQGRRDRLLRDRAARDLGAGRNCVRARGHRSAGPRLRAHGVHAHGVRRRDRRDVRASPPGRGIPGEEAGARVCCAHRATPVDRSDGAAHRRLRAGAGEGVAGARRPDRRFHAARDRRVRVGGARGRHWLGGPDPDDRTVLALSTATRHPGVAIAIAQVNAPEPQAITAAFLLAFLVGGIVSVPYVKWRARQHALGGVR